MERKEELAPLVMVPRKALQELVDALDGPGHYIRELQVIHSFSKPPGLSVVNDDPIGELKSALAAPPPPIPEGTLEWLIWSNEHRAWWASNRCGYRLDDREAGRYSLSQAKDICCVRSWENGVPPETMVHESALAFLKCYPNARAHQSAHTGDSSGSKLTAAHNLLSDIHDYLLPEEDADFVDGAFVPNRAMHFVQEINTLLAEQGKGKT